MVLPYMALGYLTNVLGFRKFVNKVLHILAEAYMVSETKHADFINRHGFSEAPETFVL